MGDGEAPVAEEFKYLGSMLSKNFDDSVTIGPGRGAPTQARKGPGRPGGFWPSDGGTLSTHITLGTWGRESRFIPSSNHSLKAWKCCKNVLAQ